MNDNTDDLSGRAAAQGEGRTEEDEFSRQGINAVFSGSNTHKQEQITSRMSRENILRSYASQDAQRARNARMYSQEVSQVYQENSTRASARAAQRAALEAEQREQDEQRAMRRRERAEAQRAQRGSSQGQSLPQTERSRTSRVVPPLSSQESYDRTRSSMESYERARASRDALSEEHRSRTPNRDVIDGRGSVDSRAFNERNELVGYSIDARDKPQAAVDTTYTDTRWHSRAGQGFTDASDMGVSSLSTDDHSADRGRYRGLNNNAYSNAGNQRRTFGGVPLFVRIAVPVIIILIILLIVILAR